jgi:FKBP-type peptidyl-prolyl cis-trans isomerase
LVEEDSVRFGFILVVLVGLVGCGGGSASTPTTPSGPTTLTSVDLVVGTGATAVNGDTLTVNYIGTLLNGTKFDSTYDRQQPFTFQLGVGQVIAGWDQGIPGMKVGGKRRLTIPPSLGYGNQTVGSIPPNSTLVFDIELMSIAGK